METDRLCASLLAATYFHRATVFRPRPGGGEEAVCEDRPCALSRSAQVSAPEPPDRAYVLPEADYRLSLYTAPDLAFRLGDRAEVRDGSGRVFRGRTSDSFRYPSHCVTVLEAVEVEEENAGQASREAEEQGRPPQTSEAFAVGRGGRNGAGAVLAGSRRLEAGTEQSGISSDEGGDGP